MESVAIKAADEIYTRTIGSLKWLLSTCCDNSHDYVCKFLELMYSKNLMPTTCQAMQDEGIYCVAGHPLLSI